MNELNSYYNNKYNKYVGARYVPIFAGEWDNTKKYEPLVIVSYQGASYTSKTFIPIGVEITNESYWVLTGNYNAQVEAYRQESIRNNVIITSRLNDIALNGKTLGLVGDNNTDNTIKLQEIINLLTDGDTLLIPKGVYIFDGQFTINKKINIISNSSEAIFKLKNNSTTLQEWLISKPLNSNFFNLACEGINLTGITFDGNLRGQENYNTATDYLTGGLIKIESSFINITNCKFVDSCNTSVHILGTDTNKRIKGDIIENCYFEGGCQDQIVSNFTNDSTIFNNILRNTDHDNIHVYQGCSGSKVINNTIINEKSGFSFDLNVRGKNSRGIVVGHPEYPNTVNNILVMGNHIINKNITTELYDCIMITGEAKNTTVTNNICEEGQVGIDINNVTRCTISNNNIINSHEDNLKIHGSTYCIVENNICDGAGFNNISFISKGIYILSSSLTSSQHNTIKNNIIYSNTITKYGLYIFNSQYNTISNNHFEGTESSFNNSDNSLNNLITQNEGITTEISVFATANVDTAGVQTISIPHNCTIIPNKSYCTINWSKGTYTNLDWISTPPIITDIDENNITIQYRVDQASTTAGASFRIYVRYVPILINNVLL